MDLTLRLSKGHGLADTVAEDISNGSCEWIVV